MSEAPKTSAGVTPLPPNIKPPYPPTAAAISRDYRKGNWTVEETLILITAKKLDDERRTTASNSRGGVVTGGGELRWKWVENYCWSNGCLRSQNQCNDKWDNLLRDYKKVREYELHLRSQPDQNHPSYWSMDKTERKHRNLPSNLLLNIYEALNHVLQKKQLPHTHSFNQQPPLAVLPPPPSPPPPPAAASEGSSETQGEEAESETKRRRRRRKLRQDEIEIGSSIIQSTTLLAQTLREHDEKKEKRHNQLLELEQQRLHLEETRNQVHRQGIAAFVTSINKLSDAIHALISEKPT